MENSNPVLLFDGVCNLCNGAVQFVIKNDKKKQFRFAALQSKAGNAFSKKYALPVENFDTFVLISNDKYYTRSDAALKVAKMLGGVWSLAYVFIIIPKTVRDAIYNWVAKNRYRWFGKKDQCMIPTPELRDRFL